MYDNLVYEVYSLFPNPELQIFRANDKVSVDALMKIGKGGKGDFTIFLNEIKTYIEKNQDKYNDDILHRNNIIDFNLITEDIT
ncbi:hypothetical protein RIR_jg34719.t1 [Rhizophagus irregularis DAOM 181602=DAOM 197198]|nr:hypothetical protein RIR_jg34719.t1 [Rhizophagus irregularis DAOM 181602=DAOM 197198]